LTDIVDRVLIMDKGKIVHSCPIGDLNDDSLRQGFGLRRINVDDFRSQLPSGNSRGSEHIVAKDLHFGYRHGPQLFSALDLKLPRGEVIGMIGGNGAGKTTLARLLTGLLRPQSGHIEIAGERLTGRQLLRHASIVLQNTDHQLHMKTVRAELAAAANGAAAGVNEDEIDATLAAYKLSSLAERHPQSLSGGEKQRLVIACGHVRRPRIFILDEPTSGLDGANLEIIADNLRRLAAEGACVLVITHDLELLASTCTCAASPTTPLRSPCSQAASHHA
ncbi:ATP-binding cassette domain-containing protein, partial [Halorhodospira halochloris]|uniref:ATP-binding cassette domain-containing protein n=1 Tax=Halorhodospira halochloris TaxID=1052 RepID=UPI001EE7E0C6